MTTTDLSPPRPSGSPTAQPETDRRAPFTRIVVASLAAGALAAAVLVLGVVPGAVEHVTTGAALLAFAAGWTLLAALTTRMTSAPQRWAYVPAAFLGTSGLALVALAPDDDSLRVASWVWPPAVLVMVAWSARRARTTMPGHTRWLLSPVLAALAVSSVGALVEDVGRQRDDSLTKPGRLYDVGGHRLHLTCRGAGSPTVVLESGLSGSSPLWTPIVDATAGTTRVCAYDRAGRAWSDDAPGPQDSLAVAADLHRLLEVAGEPGPYVLAGHSTGGVYALTYAARYPEQVAGLVLLDSTSPHQFTALPDYAGQYELMMTRLYGLAPTLARLGLGRLVPVLSANEVPGDAGRQASAFATSPRDLRTARDEVSTFHRAFTQAQALTTLGDEPLVVVTASDTLSDTLGWAAAQQDLAALSSNADLRTVRSSHGGLLDHPGSIDGSVTAVTDVVRAVRTTGPVRTR